MTAARPPEHDTSITELLSDVATGVGRLVRGELRLARVEASEAIKGAVGGMVRIGLAAVVGLVGLNVLAGTAVLGLVSAGLPAWIAGLVVALALFALCFVLILSGRSTLRLKRLLPRKAFHGLTNDAAALRAGLSGKGNPHV